MHLKILYFILLTKLLLIFNNFLKNFIKFIKVYNKFGFITFLQTIIINVQQQMMKKFIYF